MKIMNLLAEKQQSLENGKIPTIAFFGDSVTQGCFEIYLKRENDLQPIFDKEHAYHRYIAQILSVLYPNVPVNMINAGISGSSAAGSLNRLERDVLAYHPDLTVVSFGLNDCGKEEEGISEYCAALKEIFEKLKQSGSEVIFMTENMMNTYVSCHIKDQLSKDIAKDVMERQNRGILDKYFDAAKETAKACGVTVCDAYAKWKTMAKWGVDTTALLSNHINHPTREMNWLFAYSLVETMMSE